MQAKQYLMRIVFLDCMIRENEEKVKNLKELAENRTSSLNANKVQATPSKEKMADAVCNYIMLEKHIQECEAKKQEIIDTISLLNPYESAVIYQRYANDKSLGEISRIMHRSYSWVAKVHSSGIKGIQAILDKKVN